MRVGRGQGLQVRPHVCGDERTNVCMYAFDDYMQNASDRKKRKYSSLKDQCEEMK